MRGKTWFSIKLLSRRDTNCSGVNASSGPSGIRRPWLGVSPCDQPPQSCPPGGTRVHLPLSEGTERLHKRFLRTGPDARYIRSCLIAVLILDRCPQRQQKNHSPFTYLSTTA
jgi:hypothetical protein